MILPKNNNFLPCPLCAWSVVLYLSPSTSVDTQLKHRGLMTMRTGGTERQFAFAKGQRQTTFISLQQSFPGFPVLYTQHARLKSILACTAAGGIKTLNSLIHVLRLNETLMDSFSPLGRSIKNLSKTNLGRRRSLKIRSVSFHRIPEIYDG